MPGRHRTLARSSAAQQLVGEADALVDRRHDRVHRARLAPLFQVGEFALKALAWVAPRLVPVRDGFGLERQQFFFVQKLPFQRLEPELLLADVVA